MNEVRLNGRQMYSKMPKETVPCSLCGAKEFKKILDRDRYGMGVETVFCERCGFIFTNPRPTQEAMNRFYRETYRQFYTGTERPDKEYHEKLHILKRQWLVDLVKPELEAKKIQSPAVLDAGCGAGVILHIFRKQIPDSRLFGVEPFEVFAKYAAEKSGAQVVAEDIDTFLAGKAASLPPLDVVILNHSLEHLYHPVEQLIRLRELMKPDGLLLVQVPNLLSPHWDKTLPIFHIAHVNHFTPSSLRYAFERAGFECLKEFPISLPVHLKAMTILGRKKASLPSPAAVPLPAKEELASVSADLRRIQENALKNGSESSNPVIRFFDCWRERGTGYTAGRVAHYTSQLPRKALSPFKLSRWKRYDSIGGYLYHMKNDPVLRDVLAGEKVLIVGSGPSAQELESIPADVKVLTCNAGLRLFDSKKLMDRPLDLYLTRRKALIQDYPDSEELLNRVKTKTLVFDEPDFLKKKKKLSGAYEKLLADHQKDNFYLERLIKPEKLDAIKSDSVTWTSAGVRLLQYSLYFGAKEIYLIGIDLSEADYFWGGKFIHKHPIDFNFLKFVSARYKNVYSLSPYSPVTKYFPHKRPEASPASSPALAG